MVGLVALFLMTRPSKVEKFYRSLSDVLVMETESVSISKQIQQLIKEENDLYYVIISIGKEKRDVADGIKEVKQNINETSKLFTELASNTAEVVDRLQALHKNAMKIKDEKEKSRANGVLDLLENRCKLLNQMVESYQVLSEKELELYKNLGSEKIYFYKIEKSLMGIEENRKNFNYYAKKCDDLGKKINQFLQE